MNTVEEEKQFWQYFNTFIEFLEDRLSNVNVDKANLFEEVNYIGNEFYNNVIKYIIDEKLFDLQFAANASLYGMYNDYWKYSNRTYKIRYIISRRIFNDFIIYYVTIYFPPDYTYEFNILINRFNFNVENIYISEDNSTLIPSERFTETDVTEDVLSDF